MIPNVNTSTRTRRISMRSINECRDEPDGDDDTNSVETGRGGRQSGVLLKHVSRGEDIHACTSTEADTRPHTNTDTFTHTDTDTDTDTDS